MTSISSLNRARPGRRTTAVWIAIGALVTSGLAIAMWSLGDWSAAPDHLLLFGMLSVLAGASQVRPVYAAPLRIRYVATPAFVFAGVLLLPASLLTALIALSLAPTAILKRPRSEPLVGYAVNAAQALIAAHAARLLIQSDRAVSVLATPAELGVIVAAAALFVGLQVLPATALMWLEGYRGPAIFGAFDRRDLAMELAITGCGATIAQIWLYAPWGLVVTVAPLVALSRLIRRVDLATAVIDEARDGLLAYQHVEGVLTQEIRRARRYQRPLSLLLVGVDALPTLNDRKGCQAGDAVLQQLGQIIRSSLRGVDLLLRFGGDEFLVVLVETDLAQAVQTAERLRATIERGEFAIDRPGQKVQITASLSAVTLQAHGETIETLLHAADLAICQAQVAGGNRVEVAPPRRQPVGAL